MKQLIIIAAFAGTAAAQSTEFSLLASGPDPLLSPASTVEINGGRTLTWDLSTIVNDWNHGLSFIAVDLAAGSANPATIPFQQGLAGPQFANFEPPFGYARLNANDQSAFGGTVVSCGVSDIGGGQNITPTASLDPRLGQSTTIDQLIGVNTTIQVATGQVVMPDVPGTYTINIARAGANVLTAQPTPNFVAQVRPSVVVLADQTVTITVYCAADLDRNGIFDLSDITLFVSNFTALGWVSDLNDDGIFDLTDISLFVTSFVQGCAGVTGGQLTTQELELLQQLSEQVGQTNGVSSTSLSPDISNAVDTAAPFGIVDAADIAEYIHKFASRSSDADLTADQIIDIDDAAMLKSQIEQAQSE